MEVEVQNELRDTVQKAHNEEAVRYVVRLANEDKPVIELQGNDNKNRHLVIFCF